MEFDMNKYVELLKSVDGLVKLSDARVKNSIGIILDNLGYFMEEDSRTIAATIFWTYLEHDKYYSFDVVLEGLKKLKRVKHVDDVAKIYFYSRVLLDFIREFSVEIDCEDDYVNKFTPEEGCTRHNSRNMNLDEFYWDR